MLGPVLLAFIGEMNVFDINLLPELSETMSVYSFFHSLP